MSVDLDKLALTAIHIDQFVEMKRRLEVSSVVRENFRVMQGLRASRFTPQTPPANARALTLVSVGYVAVFCKYV